MGFTGLIATSQNSNLIPDLAFFSSYLKKMLFFYQLLSVILAISLTVSNIDTLVNAVSSLIIVDGNKVIKFR